MDGLVEDREVGGRFLAGLVMIFVSFFPSRDRFLFLIFTLRFFFRSCYLPVASLSLLIEFLFTLFSEPPCSTTKIRNFRACSFLNFTNFRQEMTSSSLPAHLAQKLEEESNKFSFVIFAELHLVMPFLRRAGCPG